MHTPLRRCVMQSELTSSATLWGSARERPPFTMCFTSPLGNLAPWPMGVLVGRVCVVVIGVCPPLRIMCVHDTRSAT
jgi:hypothetical protein